MNKTWGRASAATYIVRLSPGSIRDVPASGASRPKKNRPRTELAAPTGRTGSGGESESFPMGSPARRPYWSQPPRDKWFLRPEEPNRA